LRRADVHFHTAGLCSGDSLTRRNFVLEFRLVD